MPLTTGTTLGPYSVTAKIGEGGMGEVYRARDTKLDRDVALKVLPEAFTSDPDRLARFEREAKVLASLNHPNIGSIYGLEEAEGVRALVLELVEGPTLADRIKQGPIPIDEALPIAKQIAEALEAAHERGVIHRDLKPANIKVREDGTVKVLDFGLAKALDPNPDADPSQSPTLTAAATQMGVIMGTAAYMSPEQGRGKTVDKRADIWAFGVVLYEMLTGRRAFEGEDVSLTLSAVLQREPEWAGLPANVPHGLNTYLRRCLQKDPRQRVQAIGDVRLAMEGAFETPVPHPGEAAVAPPLQAWQRPVPATIAALTLLALGGLAVWTLTRPDVIPGDLIRFTIVPPDAAPLDLPGRGPDLAISPDGTQVVYQSRLPGGGLRLNLRPIDQLVGAPVRGTEGGASPFVSPDGEWVGFVLSTSAGSLQKVSIFGGPPVTLTEFPNQIAGASWGADNQIIFGTQNAGLFRVSGGGGEPEALTTLDADQGEQNHRWPFIIPGREAVVFVISTGVPLTTGQLAVLDLDTRDVTRLGLAGVSPHYVWTGHLVYAAADGSVRAVPFDATSLEVTGNPVPLVEGVVVKSSGAADFSISDNGRLVYVAGGAGGGAARTLGWVDREGQMTPVIEGAAIEMPRLSPDGTRVAFAMDSAGGMSIWIRDLERGSDTRLTVAGNNRRPAWTPDGATVTFASDRAGVYDVYSKPADGSGGAELLMQPRNTKVPGSWSPDGRTLVYYEVGSSGTGRDIWTFPVGGDPAPFLDTQFDERAPHLSPDGHWVAYVSDQAGEDRVYVQPFPEGGRVIPISTGGGIEPVWSRDGRELFYRDGNQLLVVGVATEPEFSVERPTVLFEEPYEADPVALGNPNYDVSLDGQHFLMVGSSGVDDTATLTVVLNWFEELKARVPVP